MKPIAITLGDPAGIGSEIVFKAIAELDSTIPFRLFGDRNFAAQSPNFDSRLEEHLVDVSASNGERVRFGEIDALYGKVSLAALDAALNAIDHGECSALVTAPIHKQAIAAAGASVPGHTEYLAARSGLKRYGFDYAMYFDSPTLKVVLASVHVPLRDAVKIIEPQLIAELARLTQREYQRLHGASPRIGVAGVNPHAGEAGKFGDEERLIADGVARARESGLEITGPHPPDTVFLAARRGKYDVVMAMYHDQGLIPVKTLDFERAVNVTFGLPYLRCSVDHGTAFDIAGKGVADHAPMRYAIEWAAKHAEKFRR